MTGEEHEFWVEACVQYAKSVPKYRCSQNPEKILGNGLVVSHALAKVKRDHGYRDGMPYVQTFNERVPKYCKADLAVTLSLIKVIPKPKLSC